jgi:AraC-like DNA-binding protein
VREATDLTRRGAATYVRSVLTSTRSDGVAPHDRELARLGAPWSSALASLGICRSSDLATFRDELNAMFYPARVETTSARAKLSGAFLSGIRLTHLTLGFVRFGADTSVDPGPLGCYHVNLALAGRVESVCGHRHAVASPSNAAVFSPELHTTLPHWAPDAAQLCIKIRRASLESELSALLGRPVRSAVDFELGCPLTTPAARSWLSAVGLLLAELARPDSLAGSSALYREQLERLVVSGLALAQRNAFTDELTGPVRGLRPRTVARVIALIEEHPEAPYTLADLARHAGVGARRLQQGFREHVGATPTEFLRRVRLERAHRDLLHGEESVTDVALRWGFPHLSRFARAYRAQYGILPSETRRTRRAAAP